MPTASPIHQTTEAIVRRFEDLAAIRDRALGEGRQLVRLAANSIRATHRGELETAEGLLTEAQDRLATLAGELRAFPNIYWAGYVQDAMKEVTEAALTLAIVADRPLPTPDDLPVEDAAYLNALAEAASELRRAALDRLRAGDQARAEYFLERMDEIYGALVTVDFPDAITGGLRRSTDALRAVLERTRGDVTLAVTQGRVERALRDALAAGIASGTSDAAANDGGKPV